MDLQLWLAAGSVSADSGYIVNEFPDCIKSIVINSLPYIYHPKKIMKMPQYYE